jgi:hypothetical protein
MQSPPARSRHRAFFKRPAYWPTDHPTPRPFLWPQPKHTGKSAMTDGDERATLPAPMAAGRLCCASAPRPAVLHPSFRLPVRGLSRAIRLHCSQHRLPRVAGERSADVLSPWRVPPGPWLRILYFWISCAMIVAQS